MSKLSETKTCIDCGKTKESAFAHRCFNCRKERNSQKSKKYREKHMPSKRPKSKYMMYKRGALVRGIEFNISEEQFNELWQKPCHYCGQNIETIGIDRIDSRYGYLPYNITSCCTLCNFMKRNMTDKHFIEHCIKIAHQHS